MSSPDGFIWSFDNNLYPPNASSANNELYDLDIVTYIMLGYFSGSLNANFGARWSAVMSALGLTEANLGPVPYVRDGYCVAQAIPYPTPSTLKSTDYKFPLLSCYRKGEKWTQQSTQWINIDSEYVLTLTLPPITAPQQNRMYPFLSAFAKDIFKSTWYSMDPLYNNGLLVWKAANVSFIRMDGVKYGSLLGQDGNSVFPSVQITLLVNERNQYVASNYEALTGFDVTDSIYDGYQPGNPISPFSQMTVTPGITLASVSPNTSPQAGNQLVLLEGGGFAPTNIFSVSLAGTPVTRFVYKRPNLLLLYSAPSPAVSGGDVVLTDTSGNTYTLHNAFSYV